MRAFYEVKELNSGAWVQLGDGKIMYSHDRGLRLLAALHKLNPSKTLGLHQTSTQIIETKQAKINTQIGGCWVCPKCMRIHKPEKGCGILAEARVRLPVNASMRVKTAGDTLNSM